MPTNKHRFRPLRGGSIAIPAKAAEEPVGRSGVPEPVYVNYGNGQPGTHLMSGQAKRNMVPLDTVVRRPLPTGVTEFAPFDLPGTVQKPALFGSSIAKPSRPREPKRNTIKM